MNTISKFQVEGTVLSVGPTQTFSSGFKKRQIVIETSSKPDQWSRPVALLLTKDNVQLADTLKPGVFVKTDGYIDGREWKKDAQSPVRYCTDLNVKSIMTVSAGGEAHPVVLKSPETDGPVDPDMPF